MCSLSCSGLLADNSNAPIITHDYLANARNIEVAATAGFEVADIFGAIARQYSIPLYCTKGTIIRKPRSTTISPSINLGLCLMKSSSGKHFQGMVQRVCTSWVMEESKGKTFWLEIALRKIRTRSVTEKRRSLGWTQIPSTKKENKQEETEREDNKKEDDDEEVIIQWNWHRTKIKPGEKQITPSEASSLLSNPIISYTYGI